jgi:hypothetical protein
MGYFKIQKDSYIFGINTIDQVEVGNITKEEYNVLKSVFKSLPDGKVIFDNGDGTYSYVDNPNPPDPDPDIDDAELLDILMGGTE